MRAAEDAAGGCEEAGPANSAVDELPIVRRIATAIVRIDCRSRNMFGNVGAARELAREWNEYAAQMTRDFPGRFGMLAVVPMSDIDGTLREIEYAFDTLHADGVQLMSHYEGKYPADRKFRPVLEELNKRKAIVLIHPFLPPFHDVLPGIRPRTVEFPFDTTRAIISLVLSGTTSQLPDIRYLATAGAHFQPLRAASKN